jgi:hypothetical protein
LWPKAARSPGFRGHAPLPLRQALRITDNAIGNYIKQAGLAA